METTRNLRIYTDTGIKLIIVHPTEDVALIKYLPQLFFATESNNPEFGWISKRTFRIVQLSYRNSQTSPCQGRHQVVKCLVKCLENQISAKITQGFCRLPYVDDSNAHLPVCKSEKELYAMLNATLSALENFRQEECLCTEICRQIVYSTEFLHEEVLNAPGGLLIVELRVRDNRIMSVEESSSYTGVALFADIGGTFGLFTGLCVLNMFEIIESFYSKSKRVMIRMFCNSWKEKDTVPAVLTVIIKDINSTSSLASGYSNVTIPGLARSVDKKSPLLARSLWVIISAGALIICGYQFTERLQYYLSDPTEVRMHYSNNKSITFPLTLICPFQRNSIYRKGDNGIHFRHYWNVKQLLGNEIWISINEVNAASVSFKKYSPLAGHIIPKNGSVVLTIETTSAGICLMTKINGPVTYKGYRTSVDVAIFSKSSKPVWMAYFSSDDKRIVNYMSQKLTFMGSMDNIAELSLQIMEVFHRNTHQNPCVNGEKSSICVINCLEDKIFARVNVKCRLPFMKESREYPPCHTQEEYLALKNASVIELKSFNSKGCNCPRNCKEIIYFLEEAKIESIPSNIIELKLRVPENRIAVIQEEAAYGFVRLLSDLGGCLGLFFGIGLIQILELVAARISESRK